MTLYHVLRLGIFAGLTLSCSRVGAAETMPPSVQLILNGTVDGGTLVTDQAAYVRLLPSALPGWDINDASKLLPFSPPYALLSPVGERNGERYRLSVNSLPDGSPGTLTQPVTVPIDFLTTLSGTFSISWVGPSALPTGWGAFLRDYQTGTLTDLRAESAYAFSSAATDWSERFQLILVSAGVTAQASIANGPGWRLLSAPVNGLTVHDLAGMNLVQGIAAGTPAATFPAQYPTVGSNIFTGYDGSAYSAPVTTDQEVEPGRGFFWHWYDADFGPFVGGTSQSHDLSGFVLSAAGSSPTADVSRAFAPSTNGFYLAGNPFNQPLSVVGVTANAPVALVTTLQAFDPLGGYVQLFASNPGNGQPDLLAPWQGVFVEVDSGPPATGPTVSYDFESVVPGGTAPFYGKSAEITPYLHLTLDGATATGLVTRDEASWIRFLPDALFGWDQHDASKLVPLQTTWALIAPVGERNGAPYRLSVNSLPSTFAGPIEVPLEVAATDGGTYVLSWTGASTFAPSRSVELVDQQTGTTVDLRTSPSHAFAQDQSDWSQRFVVRIGAAGVDAEPRVERSAFALHAPSPNPVSGRTTLLLEVGTAQRIAATLVDALGRTVRTLLDADVATGTIEVPIDASMLSPGVYSVRVQGSTEMLIQRLLVVR